MNKPYLFIMFDDGDIINLDKIVRITNIHEDGNNLRPYFYTFGLIDLGGNQHTFSIFDGELDETKERIDILNKFREEIINQYTRQGEIKKDTVIRLELPIDIFINRL